jgi:hypothetical protein
VHFLEAEDADRAALLLCAWAIGADADALKGLRSQTSSVIAFSAIAESEWRMPRPRAARWTLTIRNTRLDGRLVGLVLSV